MASDVFDADVIAIRAIEEELAAPHDPCCFEVYAEVAIETGKAETGQYDEVMSDGASLMIHFHREMRERTAKCWCRRTAAEAWGE